ncbi:MAG: hypothetical protein EXX96DRAFT_609612 [Benjaminiella poitrasii]|nr:MAG: hypothetical protein EXX96DRAFT_609612 [Benjaminiella poitrasii]
MCGCIKYGSVLKRDYVISATMNYTFYLFATISELRNTQRHTILLPSISPHFRGRVIIRFILYSTCAIIKHYHQLTIVATSTHIIEAIIALIVIYCLRGSLVCLYSMFIVWSIMLQHQLLPFVTHQTYHWSVWINLCNNLNPVQQLLTILWFDFINS